MVWDANLWVVVLAAGEGRRLSAFTTDAHGASIPKQFCSFGRARPMLQWAFDRAKSLAPVERIVTIVAREHRTFWEHEVEGLPVANVIVQPANRGTAAGILLPLLEILDRDPAATVVVLPSDHYVAEEETLRRSVERAVDEAVLRPERVILLGITPESVETEYGWILPAERRGSTYAVARFTEKPCAAAAVDLLRRGAVWNSFVVVGSGWTILELSDRTVPEVVARFRSRSVGRFRPAALEALYETLPAKDFSRDVLQAVTDRLALLVVPPCGWTDLGTPARLGKFLSSTRGAGARASVLSA